MNRPTEKNKVQRPTLTSRLRTRRAVKTASTPSTVSRDRHLLVRVVCLLLIVNLLTLSVPAAVVPLARSAANGLAEEVRFGFYGGGWDLTVPQLLGFFARGAATMPSQTTAVSRVRVYPGSVTVRQNDPVVLSAVAFDEQDAPLIAPDVTWTRRDEAEQTAPETLPAGTFTAETVGTFTVTATSGGRQAAATVTVVPALAAPAANSATGGKTGAADEQRRAGEKVEGPISQRPGDPHWEPGDTGSSNDPGNQPGNPPGAPLDDGAGNGNFQLSAPVVTLPGRGLDLALNLQYNSRLWNKSGNQLTYDIDGGSPAPGWSLGFGKMIFMGGIEGCMLVDADGTRHGYTGTPNSYPQFSSFTGHVTDSSFIDYNCSVSYGTSGISTGRSYLANGTIIDYYSKGPDNATLYPTKITDAQGNYISITYVTGRNSAIETITDTLGRVIMFHYDANERLTSVSAPRMTGQGTEYGSDVRRTVIRLHYRQLPLVYSFPGKTVSAGDNAPWVIDSIYYPATGTGYWFGGDNPPQPDYSAYYSSYGMLTKIEEQRGMSFAGDVNAAPQGTVNKGLMSKLAVYNYPLTTANEAGRTDGLNLSDAPTYTRLAESWAGMDVPGEEAVTTYSVQQNASPRVTTVIQPNGAVSRQLAHNYSSLADSNPVKRRDGMVYQDESYVEDPNGSSVPNTPTGKTYRLVGKSFVEWGSGYRNVPLPIYTETFDENNHKVRNEFDYSNGMFNQVRFACDYNNDYVRLRCTTTEFENSPAYIGSFDGNGNFQGGRHILNLVKATGVNNPDAGLTRASWTKYEYDGNPLAPTPGVIQHDPAYDPGNTDTYQVCHWVCPTSCRTGQPAAGNSDGSQHRCECLEENVCTTYNVFKPETNARGNVTKVTTYADAQNLTGAIEQTSSYDITGNLVTASTSCCQQTSFQYTSATKYGYPESQTRGSADPNSPDRITTSAVYSIATGLVTQSTDANGRASNILYNPDTMRPRKTTSPTGAYSINSYNDAVMTVTDEAFEADGTTAGKAIKTLNGVGQTRRQETVGPNNVSDFVDTQYNKYGQTWKESRPYRTGDTLQWTTTIYDGQGRTVELIAPDNSSSKAFYNERTQIPDSATKVSGNVLPPGNVIRVADAWGRERWGRYDQQNRLVEVVEPKADGDGKVATAGSAVTKYQYDTLGRLTQTEQIDPQPGGPTSQFRKFKYDSLGRLTRQKLAEQTATINDGGTWVGAGGTGAVWSEAFVYDSRSNLTQKTDARGVRTNYAYYNLTTGAEDPLNRIQAMIYDTSGPRLPDSVLPIHAAYNVTYEYMTTGDVSRIKKVETPGLMKEEYAYDPQSRVQDYKQTIATREARPFVTSYTYDTLDRVKETLYPEQWGMSGLAYPRRKVENSYDTASRLTALTVNGTQQAGSIAYNAADQTTSIKIGAAGINQVTENYTFDEKTGRLINQNIQRLKTRGSETLLDLTYEYDRKYSNGTGTGATGHISKIVDNLNGAKNRQYRYDALGRLVEAKGGDTLWQTTYTYDRYGNRLNVAASGAAADGSAIPLDGIPNLAYDATSNRITTSGFQYDAAGNQIRARAEDGTSWLKYEYDAANRLRIIKKDDGSNNGDGAPVQAFLCGASNARIFADDYKSGEKTVYATLGGTTIAEYIEEVASVPKWTKSYVFMGDSLLSTATPNGASAEFTEYSHPDLLGTRTITNQPAGTSYEQKTLPFGKALSAESTANTNRRFTSYDRSSATGLDYAVNRTYDSKQGRFTQVDPIGMRSVSLAAPQTLNLYSYCANDPINHTDPSGLFWGFFKKLFKWVIIAVAVIVAIISIATIVAAPISISGILGIISAATGAASAVLGGLGYQKAAMIFGLISIGTGFGSIIAARQGKGLILNLAEKAARANVKFAAEHGILLGVGAIANFAQQQDDKKKKKRDPIFLGGGAGGSWDEDPDATYTCRAKGYVTNLVTKVTEGPFPLSVRVSSNNENNAARDAQKELNSKVNEVADRRRGETGQNYKGKHINTGYIKCSR